MEIESSIIETGVDKLVKLVKDRGRIPLADAAKELGVSSAVIQEWVDFLEDEGIISVEYKMTKPYLVERKLTKKEVEQKEKEFTGKKDVFVRKAEISLGFLENQAEQLKKAKGDFDKLKSELGFNLDSVKEELAELERYHQLKEELGKEIEAQKSEVKSKIEELTRDILREQRRYMEIVSEVDKERKELLKEKEESKSLEESEKILHNKLAELKEITDVVEKKIAGQNTLVKSSESQIERLNLLMESVKRRVEEEKAGIDQMVSKSQEHEKKVLEAQDNILKKISENEKKASNAKDITQKFKTLFEKKLGAVNLIYKVNKDRDELETNLMELIKKAKSFQLTMKKRDVGNEMVELEKKFNEVDKKKKTFEEELKTLMSFFSK